MASVAAEMKRTKSHDARELLKLFSPDPLFFFLGKFCFGRHVLIGQAFKISVVRLLEQE